MGKSTSVKREIRFQQWIQQVKEYNERPDGMSMSAWCKSRGIAQSTFATRLQKVQDRCLESVSYTHLDVYKRQVNIRYSL